MRDIRFRGKRIDNGEWVEGHYLTRRSDDGLHHMISVQDMWGFHEVDPETVCQYTGVKNTYQGDILPPDEQWGEVTIICYDKHQACYKRVPLGLYKANAGGGGWSGMPLRWHSPEPIGNIHDNPELITA